MQSAERKEMHSLCSSWGFRLLPCLDSIRLETLLSILSMHERGNGTIIQTKLCRHSHNAKCLSTTRKASILLVRELGSMYHSRHDNDLRSSSSRFCRHRKLFAMRHEHFRAKSPISPENIIPSRLFRGTANVNSLKHDPVIFLYHAECAMLAC